MAFSVARREASERSKRGKRSSRPITSRCRTRSASSSSSCPVSSPSRTTIVLDSMCLLGLGRRLRGYIRDSMVRRGGWRRLGSRGRFRYVDARGRRIADADALERIDSLRIPPAWHDVRISPRARAKLQATGLDRAGRLQDLYHPEFRARQEAGKFEKLLRVGQKLPDFREAKAAHLQLDPRGLQWTPARAVRLVH